MAKKGFNIYRRKDGHGRWEGRYKCGFKPDGSVKYVSVYGKSYSAVKELLEEKKLHYATIQNVMFILQLVSCLIKCFRILKVKSRNPPSPTTI
ncbi:MAG: hypothetical protein NC177_17160 [Ruminococcus flavefaciens]|nr:hypothetical protein [Ruminococcus flavefaciens]